MSYLLLCSALKLLDLPMDMSPEPPFLCLDQDLLCLPRILLSVYLLGTIVLYSKTCLFYHPFVFLSQSIVQVGTEVEFALTSVNVVGKPSDRSESSPVYRVIGRCNSRSFMLYGNSKEITIQSHRWHVSSCYWCLEINIKMVKVISKMQKKQMGKNKRHAM